MALRKLLQLDTETCNLASKVILTNPDHKPKHPDHEKLKPAEHHCQWGACLTSFTVE